MVDRDQLRAVAIAADARQRAKEAAAGPLCSSSGGIDACDKPAVWRLALDDGYVVLACADHGPVGGWERIDDLPDGWEWKQLDGGGQLGVAYDIVHNGNLLTTIVTSAMVPFGDELADMVCRWFAQIGDRQ